ncbi:MAG: imidazole glycerol phosphate synthase subunit HisH [Synergistaceae bacterium]|jgi:glutamine amidotransferase|nr:imidazole glycerol phosphate synthase subunit HisH [Synergistaceae bacterium]
MIGIIDFGMGNLKSVSNAFRLLGFDAFIAAGPEELDKADKIVLPGVGAFEGAIAELRRRGWAERVSTAAASGTPLLGICLGMQLLFETGYENGEHEGLGILPGHVDRIPDAALPGDRKLKIPQVGWNLLEMRGHSAILPDSDCAYVYFVHSYYAVTEPEYVTAVTRYGSELTAAVERGNVFGVQFHPEKSGDCGLDILRRFAEANIKRRQDRGTPPHSLDADILHV